MRRWIVAACLPLVVAGCSSTSSDDDNGTRTYTSFKSVGPLAEFTIHGVGNETTYTSTDDKVTGVNEVDSGNASVDLKYDSDSKLHGLTVDGPETTTSWDTQDGDTAMDLGNGVGAFVSKDEKDVALFADPDSNGFQYQSFGVWETGIGTGGGTVGTVSAGWPTDGGKIPTSGTGTFTGKAGGLYVDSAGAEHSTTADASLNADFAHNSATFATTGTMSSTDVTLPGTSNADLDLSGSMEYGDGSNSMAGTITNAGGDMTGTVKGRFYGPEAVEAGGVFSLRGTGTEAYEGAFGVKR